MVMHGTARLIWPSSFLGRFMAAQQNLYSTGITMGAKTVFASGDPGMHAPRRAVKIDLRRI